MRAVREKIFRTDGNAAGAIAAKSLYSWELFVLYKLAASSKTVFT